VSLRRSGATLLLGLEGIGVSHDAAREDGVLSRLTPPSPDGRRGVCGKVGAAEVSCGATEEARDQEGEAVVDETATGTGGARDQPNNDARIAVEDGSGGGDVVVTSASSSPACTDPACSLMEGSVSTDATIPKRLFTCVEDKGCLISTTSRTGSKERARVLISFAIAAGDANGMRYTSASHCRFFHGQPSLCMSTSCMRCFSTRAFAALGFIPSRPESTHDALQIPQTSLSFPSFTHPHFAAARASIAGGLLAYVLSLYVARRSSKLCVDDGRYSYDAAEPELLKDVDARNLAGSALRVLAAVRARMAAR